jgi:hypothetical protein
MARFIYQRRKEEIKRVYTALTNGVNPLSSEDADIVETCYRILGIECQVRHSSWE